MSGELRAVEAFDVAQSRGSRELIGFASDLQMAHQAAQMLVTTSFVPQSYRGRPDEAAVAIVTGIELGLSPMAALRSIDIVNGTPALRAITLRALVQKHGHEIWVEESTSHRAVVKGRRRGKDTVEQSVWDMDRARQLGLVGKENWRRQPQAMLLARATSELARLIDADGILGLAYTTEELSDTVSDVPVQEKVPSRRVSRAKKPEPHEVEVKVVETGDAEVVEAVDAVEEQPVEGDAVADSADQAEVFEGVFGDLPEGFQS